MSRLALIMRGAGLTMSAVLLAAFVLLGTPPPGHALPGDAISDAIFVRPLVGGDVTGEGGARMVPVSAKWIAASGPRWALSQHLPDRLQRSAQEISELQSAMPRLRKDRATLATVRASADHLAWPLNLDAGGAAESNRPTDEAVARQEDEWTNARSHSSLALAAEARSAEVRQCPSAG